MGRPCLPVFGAGVPGQAPWGFRLSVGGGSWLMGRARPPPTCSMDRAAQIAMANAG